eukprot:9234826-Lingulodinium_polyedra.AAC.1
MPARPATGLLFRPAGLLLAAAAWAATGRNWHTERWRGPILQRRCGCHLHCGSGAGTIPAARPS